MAAGFDLHPDAWQGEPVAYVGKHRGIRNANPIGPCAGCRFAPGCAKMRLACADFTRFVSGGRTITSKRREPTRGRYVHAFPSEFDAATVALYQKLNPPVMGRPPEPEK
jgi:hypothetical protein